jgi:sulfhydrogenase subunit alpha
MKTLKLEPLSRVEGHGRVELILRDNRLADARVAITESPRLFEGLVAGRSFREVPALVCRICAICSSVHRVAAAGALEKALGVEVPRAARMVRELLMLGGHIESHALHLFCLVLPDICGTENIIELLRSGNETARQGLALKGLGNRIQEIAGGRVIHPINVEVGGVLRLPERKKLEELLEEIDLWTKRLKEISGIFARDESYPPSVRAVGTRISVGGGDGFSLTGDALKLSDGRTVPAGHYRELLAERPVSYSNAKHSGEEGRTFLAGALARLENGPGEPTPGMAEGGIFRNNAAQAAELLWALGRCLKLGRELLNFGEEEAVMMSLQPKAGIGTEVIEAPRGLLIHHYVLDDLGRVVSTDIVTPTAINQATMEEQLLEDLAEIEDETELSERAQCLVRAFDPCISCSVHVVKAGKK